MTRAEIREKIREEQLESFKEFIELSCKEIAMCCRATNDVVGDTFDVKQFVADSARKWFDYIEGLSDAEFDFLTHKELAQRILAERSNDDTV